ncbi:hypothetical protein GCM10025859_66760 [Alicyclobacillus fastidiosus]|nr:hypothetical protein GCM10025859_66760 [Alicyclobacillus fastidiosus]
MTVPVNVPEQTILGGTVSVMFGIQKTLKLGLSGTTAFVMIIGAGAGVGDNCWSSTNSTAIGSAGSSVLPPMMTICVEVKAVTPFGCSIPLINKLK